MADEVLQAMDEQYRERLEAVLFYPEDTAGGLMNVDVLTVRADVSLETVCATYGGGERFQRKPIGYSSWTEKISMWECCGSPICCSAVRKTRCTPTLLPNAMRFLRRWRSRDVARLFEQRNLISAPVIGEAGHLIGRITVDDVVDVIRDEGDRAFMGMAGLDQEDDLFASVLVTSRHRMLWLGVNLATALLASCVIGLFEDTIEKVVALAVLMPVVASMGGIAGSQTLTIVIRGMALGQVGRSNASWLLNREVMVGFLNSVLWATVVAVIATYWFGQPALGLIVAAALIINLVIAATAGTLLPLVMRRLLIDPALAGSVVLTTITDVVGFMTFLGLGALFLVN